MLKKSPRFPVMVRSYMTREMVARLAQEADRLSAENSRRVSVAELIRVAVNASLDHAPSPDASPAT